MIVVDKPKLKFLLQGRSITVTVHHDRYRRGRTSRTTAGEVISSWSSRKIGRQEMSPPDAQESHPTRPRSGSQ